MKRKLYMTVLAMLLCAASLTGCRNQEDADSSKFKETQVEEEENIPDEEIELD